jgi:hypothetical protein
MDPSPINEKGVSSEMTCLTQQAVLKSADCNGDGIIKSKRAKKTILSK